MEYEILYYPKAESDLSSINPTESLKIVDAICRFLKTNPYPHKQRKKKIQGAIYPLYRLRVTTKEDSYRIFYTIEKKSIIILRIVKRKDVDRIIKRLKKEAIQIKLVD